MGKVSSILFVLFCLVAHFAVVFYCDIYDDERDALRFHLIHGLLLFQWMMTLCFLMTWFQNYRFEYAIEKLLDEGHSLFYLLNDRSSKLNEDENLKKIQSEIDALSMRSTSNPLRISKNDANLLDQNTNENTLRARSFRIIREEEKKDDEYSEVELDAMLDIAQRRIKTLDREEERMEMEQTQSCWMRCIGVSALKLIMFLPQICLLNGMLNGYFGLFVCDLEIIWLQHLITVAVIGVHSFCTLCMKEKNLILNKEAAIMRPSSNSLHEDIQHKIQLVKTESDKWRPQRSAKTKETTQLRKDDQMFGL